MSTIVLRPLEEEHLPVVLTWVNTPFVHESVGTVRPVSMSEHRQWYQRLQRDPTKLVLVMCDTANSLRPVGLVGLTGIDLVYRNAELWLYLGERASQRRGFGRIAVTDMLEIAFGRLGLNRVYIHVFEYNETALAFFAACGFRHEGRLRQAAFKKGRYWDKLVMSMLASEFQPVGSLPERQAVHAANVQFHSALAASGGYEKQPFLAKENADRVGGILADLRAHAPGGRLLDVGCGMGFVIGLALPHFDSVDGIDITPAMLERVPKSPKVHVQVAPVEALPYGDASFDVVTAYGVLHHLHELAPAFAEIRRVLKPGGLFYADESPNYDCLTALRELPLSGGLGPVLRQQAEAVKGDVDAYRDRFGIETGITSDAMYQDKRLGGLQEERVTAALLGARFSNIRFDYRWYLGQGQDAPAEAAQRERFLRGLLPLSRPLFKYVQIVASAAP